MSLDAVRASGAALHRADCVAAARRLFDRGPIVRRLMQHGRPYICPFERVIEAVPHDAAVLDVGCGDGLLLGLLAWSGRLRSGLGFDASAAAIDMANAMRSNLPQPSRLAFECRQVGDPWPAGHFDAVTVIDLLHHLPPGAQRPVLEQAARRVAPGGVLVVKDMASRPRWRAAVSRLHDLVVARQRIHLMDFDVVRAALERQQLMVESRATLSTGPYLHELAVFRRPPLSATLASGAA